VIDYVVVKWPRFAFEKFPGADSTLGTQMKSVGEVMSIGRTFCESLQKAARSLETSRDGLVSLEGRVDYRLLAEPKKQRDMGMEAAEVEPPKSLPPPTQAERLKALRAVIPIGTADRLFYVADALRAGIGLEEVHALTKIDPWFLAQIERIVKTEKRIAKGDLGPAELSGIKRLGFSDAQIARLLPGGKSEADVRALRKQHASRPVYARVDTCAAEFVAHTPYLYSTYESESEAKAETGKKKVVILGGGPNRIGQGIEFDYCCVHAVQALRELGFETVMVNCNPETVSTDYDTSDRLYFEPLTLEDVLEICEEEKRSMK
jgi:carbamoyl-phosphate synthase large subunit